MSNIEYFMSGPFKCIGVVKNSPRSNIYPMFYLFLSRNVQNILYIQIQNVMWKQSKRFKSSKKIIVMETNIVIFHIRLNISMISNSLNTHFKI